MFAADQQRATNITGLTLNGRELLKGYLQFTEIDTSLITDEEWTEAERLLNEIVTEITTGDSVRNIK